MRCRSCGHVLDADARFCPACGTALGEVCGHCGASSDPDARYCKQCGRALETTHAAPATPIPPSVPARERKVATLLFADLVGFTRFAEAHDPEIVSALVASTFERLSQEVARYEGTVEKFAGDAVLAVFGVPVLHEDDPERAVRAALEMQASMARAGDVPGASPRLSLRIGIECGEVLVDLARARDERDLFVTGDAVNTAARLQAAAEPGAVVVGPSAYAASRDIIEYRELPALALRGKALPVPAWHAVGVKARRADRRPLLGMGSPLVGREHELTMLKGAVRRAAAEGRPHLVTLVGSAGVGKSRLAWELETYLDGLPRAHLWRKGRCLAYASRSFGPLADIVRMDAGIQDDDAPPVTRDKIRRRLAELSIDDVEAPAILDAQEAVLAVGEARDRPREALFESWRRYLCALAASAPLVLVFEDIHWADDGTLAFLDFLARWGEGPLVILCLARHELLEAHAGWGGGLKDALTIFVEPLTTEATGKLMDGLLAGGVSGPLRERIVERVEGNPLFAEESVRMLVDRGVVRFADGHWELAHDVAALDIPPSVQAVLAARLDSLPPEEKRVAQDAAVVGRIFWDVVVAYLAGLERGALDELMRRLRVRDLVVPRRPSSLADAAEYAFRHALVRDVAYDSLPKRDRARLHRDVAAWAEQELADRIDEFAELIADHLATALAYDEEIRLDDDEDLRLLRGLAQRAALRAARRAAAVSQMASAARWLRLAVDLVGRLGSPPREMAALAHEYAEVGWENADPGERDVVLAAAIDGLAILPGRTPDDDRLLAVLREQRGQALYEAGEPDAAEALLHGAIADLGSGQATPERAALLNRLGWVAWRRGRVADAVPILEQALAEAAASGDDRSLRWATANLGAACGFLGRSDEAVTLLEDAFRQAREADDRALLLRCYINVPATRYGRGDPIAPLIALADEGLVLARRAAATHTLAWLAGNRAEFSREAGRLDEALEHADEAVRNATVISPAHQAARLLSRAIIHRLRGEVAQAERDVDEAMRISSDEEAQVASLLPRNLALRRWSDQPRAAATDLLAWCQEHRDSLGPRNPALQDVARMALRISDATLVAHAADLHRATREEQASSIHAARDGWIDGLAAADLHAVEKAAADFEAQGYRVSAADAWADAALMADRAAVASPAVRMAMSLRLVIGLRPLLGVT